MTRTLVATPDPEPKPRYQVLPIITAPIHPSLAKFFLAPITLTTVSTTADFVLSTQART